MPKRERKAEKKEEVGKKKGKKAAKEENKPEKPLPVRPMIPRSLTPRQPLLPDSTPHLRMLSYNVNGLRAMLRKEESRDALASLLADHRPHILALQETKINPENEADVTESLQTLLAERSLPTYTAHFFSATAKKGYSGTAMLLLDDNQEGSGPKVISVSRGMDLAEGDAEGRVMTVEYESCFVVNSYTPNAGDKLQRLTWRTTTWDAKLADYVSNLSATHGKPAILGGDLNAVDKDVDFFNPHEPRAKKQACTTPEERKSFAAQFLGNSFKDTFRLLHPNAEGCYTYFSTRARNRPFNRGLRIDYWLVPETAANNVYDAYIVEEAAAAASDHSPVGLIFKV
ncbi:unnamed protein product [Chrysoparadoxa australica]